MRVCCFYTSLHPACEAALPPGTELVWTGADDQHYWRELMARWDGSDDLVTIEHDVEIHDGVLPAFAACGAAWCAFAYEYSPATPGTLATGALGCTRFSTRVQRQFPDIAAQAAAFAVANGLPAVPPWDACDSWLRRALEVEALPACQHEPLVRHYRRAADIPVGT